MSLKTKSVENYAVQSHGEATGVGRFGHRGEAEVEHGEGGDTGECGGGCRWGGYCRNEWDFSISVTEDVKPPENSNISHSKKTYELTWTRPRTGPRTWKLTRCSRYSHGSSVKC